MSLEIFHKYPDFDDRLRLIADEKRIIHKITCGVVSVKSSTLPNENSFFVLSFALQYCSLSEL